MSEKPYKYGMVVGLFQPVHNGHVEIIKKAQEICERVIIFVGSAQEERTEKNPFSYMERVLMLESYCSRDVSFVPVEDQGLGNTPEWGNFLMDEAKKNSLLSLSPDILISGEEERREAWGLAIPKLYIPKKNDLHATDVRDALLRDDWNGFCKMAPYQLQKYYQEMRKIVVSCAGKK